MKFLSPLRYPGGKAKMAPFLEQLVLAQEVLPVTYAEPFAGGAGAALHLLTEDIVEGIALNDLNVGIAAFWRSVFRNTDALLTAIEDADVSLDEWHRQREVYLDESAEEIDRGFATFYLNRTNRSGILGARPIGGLEQLGTWKIDARFNKSNLQDRVGFLGKYRARVQISNLDGKAFLRSLDEQYGKTLFYVDPPYLKQGEDLYLANMTYNDHVSLARTLTRLKSPWVLTYDRDERVPNELYAGMPCAEFSVSHTAGKQHLGSEYLVTPAHVRINSLDGFGPRPGQWLDGRSPAAVGGKPVPQQTVEAP